MIALILTTVILLILHLIKIPSISKYYINYEIILSGIMIIICAICFIQSFNFWHIILIIIYFFIFFDSLKQLK